MTAPSSVGKLAPVTTSETVRVMTVSAVRFLTVQKPTSTMEIVHLRMMVERETPLVEVPPMLARVARRPRPAVHVRDVEQVPMMAEHGALHRLRKRSSDF